LDTNIIKILTASPLFQGISASDLEVMLECLKPKIYHYNKNSYITVEGETYTGVGILLAGEASIIKESDQAAALL
jgi:hypothetical protein